MQKKSARHMAREDAYYRRELAAIDKAYGLRHELQLERPFRYRVDMDLHIKTLPLLSKRQVFVHSWNAVQATIQAEVERNPEVSVIVTDLWTGHEIR